MIRKAKKHLALLLALCLLPVLAGCGESSTVTAAIPNEDHTVSASEEAQETIPVEYYADSPDKSESVSVKTTADGTPEKVTVSVTLVRRDDQPIRDQTNLTEIKNTEGNESFTLQNNGSLVWENKGRNISYEGKADAEALPVGVHLSFELDGKPVTAEEIAGKSGEVTIHITYENRSKEVLGGFVPFTAMTVLVLGENFYNVDVDNGSVMEISDTTAVLGYALPGLSDALQLTEYEPFKDTELPESVEITAYTTDFEIQFSTTAFSNGIFSDIEEEDLKDLDDLYANSCDTDNGLNELEFAGGTINSAVAALVSGLKSVLESMGQMSEAISGTAVLAGTITVPGEAAGVSSIRGIDAIPALSMDGLSKEAVAAVAGYVANANAQIAAANATIADANIQIDAANATIASYNGSRAALAEQVATLQAMLNAISESLSGVSTDTSSVDAVNEGVSNYVSAVNGVCDSLKGNLWLYAGSDFLNLKDNLRTLRDNDIAYTNFSGCYAGETSEVTFLFETAEIK